MRKRLLCVAPLLCNTFVVLCGIWIVGTVWTEPVFCSSEKEEKAAAGRENPDPCPQGTDQRQQTAGKTAPGQPAPSRPQELFDGRTLTGWQVLGELAFKGHGKVEVREGAILLGRGEPFTGVRWTGAFPRCNYEVLVEARRVEGDDFFCGLVFPVGEADCSLVVGGWGGSIVGLSNIDGEPAAENETAASRDFEKGCWYSIRLRVDDRKVQVWIDREKVIDLEYPDRKLSIRWDQEPMRPFGICTWQTTGAVRKVSLRRLCKEDLQPEPPKPPQSRSCPMSASPQLAGFPVTPRQPEWASSAAASECVSAASSAASDAQGRVAEFAVPQTFDGQPCRCQEELQKTEPGFRIYRWRYPSPVRTQVVQNNTIPAEYYLPTGAEQGPPRPAVIVLHILHGNYELERLLCRTLALRGIPALMFKLPYYGERSMDGSREAVVRSPELFVEALPQAIADCRRSIDVLSARPEVDSRKISIAGISLGGIVGATAAGSDVRVHRAALILAGGDLLTIVNHCREARSLRQFLQSLPADRRQIMEKALEAIDPLRHAAALRDRALAGRVLMVNAAEDEVIPKTCTEKLAQALGIADRVIWLEGLGHYTAIAALPQTLQRTTAFFAEDLPPGVQPCAAQQPPSDSPEQVLISMVRQLLHIFFQEPKAGQCHLLDLSAEVQDSGGKKYEGRLRWIRGVDRRFRLEVKISGLPEACLGQGDRPWLASANRVFVGRVPQGAPRVNPLEFVNPRHLTRVQAWTAALNGLLQMPGLLNSLVEVEEVQQEASLEKTPPKAEKADSPRLVRVWQKDKKQNTLQIWLEPDGRPSRAEVSVDKVHGKITIHAWQQNSPAPEPLFQPPDRPVQEVPAEDLVRIWSSLVDFLMEKTE